MTLMGQGAFTPQGRDNATTPNEPQGIHIEVRVFKNRNYLSFATVLAWQRHVHLPALN
jgi:hypothetical protein